MKDPKREEPLVGLEHVVEIRFEGRREPHYECKLCEFNTEMAPMIEHLSGYKHRRASLSKEFLDKIKKSAPGLKEHKVAFLRRAAREMEKTEGLKMYKIEGYTRPSTTSASSKKKSRWEDYNKPENDPVRKQKALEYLETFRVTSDAEATLVISVTQDLTEALKTFCKKKAAVSYASSLRPLMSISQDELSTGKNIQKPYKSYGNYKGISGSTNWNQDLSSQIPEQAQFTSQLAANTSFTPASSYSYQTGDESSSYGLRPNDSATMAALSNSFALQTGGFATGINECLKQFNQSASVPSQSTSVEGTSPSLTYSGSGYSTEYKSKGAQGNKTTAPDNRMTYGVGGTNWKSQGAFTNTRNLPDQGSSYSTSSATYPSSGRYSTSYPLQGYSSYYSGGSANSTSSSSGGSSWPEESRYQKSDFKTDSASFRSSSSVRNSYRDYQQQSRESDRMFDGDASGLTPNILNRLRGKDEPTMTRMLKQLTPYYPALQKINIQALVKALIETREIN
ncbi:serine-rich adhesin for platelets-like isoform X2 [Emydura macquarii macquarii]